MHAATAHEFTLTPQWRKGGGTCNQQGFKMNRMIEILQERYQVRIVPKRTLVWPSWMLEPRQGLVWEEKRGFRGRTEWEARIDSFRSLLVYKERPGSRGFVVEYCAMAQSKVAWVDTEDVSIAQAVASHLV